MPFSSVVLCVRSFAGYGCVAECYVFECEACLHPYLLVLLRTLWNIAYSSPSGDSYTERVHTARARRAHTSHCCLMLRSVPNILYSKRSKSPSSSTLKIQYKIARAFADCTMHRTPHHQSAIRAHHSTHGGNRSERRCQPRETLMSNGHGQMAVCAVCGVAIMCCYPISRLDTVFLPVLGSALTRSCRRKISNANV